MNDYLALLEHSYAVAQDDPCPPADRASFLSQHIFDFTTYDGEMDSLFGTKGVEVCAAISAGKTFDYIAAAENYRWYLWMCNTSFFAGRIEWGTSIRGAWWDRGAHHFGSCGLFRGYEQIDTLTFAPGEWPAFIAAIVKFAGLPESASATSGPSPEAPEPDEKTQSGEPDK